MRSSRSSEAAPVGLLGSRFPAGASRRCRRRTYFAEPGSTKHAADRLRRTQAKAGTFSSAASRRIHLVTLPDRAPYWRGLLMLVPVIVLALAGCGDDTSADGAADAASSAPASPVASEAGTDQRHPDIVKAEVMPAGEEAFDIAVTVSSPYDSPDRYADGWRVLTPDGTELGTHTLMHDHAGEQPFTRTQSGVEIPADVAEVTIEGRDQQYGFGGETVTVTVPHDQG